MLQEVNILENIEEIQLYEPLDVYLQHLNHLISSSFSFQQPQLSYQFYYQTVELICQCSQEKELLDFLKNLFQQLFMDMIDQSSKIEKLESIYKYFLDRIRGFYEMIQLLSDIFLYFNQTFLVETKYKGIEELIIEILKQELQRNPNILMKISQYICEQLNIQRHNLLNLNISEELSNLDEFKQIVDFFELMNFFKEGESTFSFEQIFSQNSFEYFTQLREILDTCNLDNKIQIIYKAAEAEKLIQKKLLEDRFGHHLENQFKSVVIQPQIEKLLDCFSLFSQEKYQIISQLYNILEKNGHLKKFRKNIYIFIQQEGEKILNQESNVSQVEQILQLREKIEQMNVRIFDNEFQIIDMEHQAFTDFVSSKVNTLTELFTQYLDGKLTKKGKSINEEHNLQKEIERSLSILRYFTASDIFETFFTQRLTRRILLDLSYSYELEYDILNKLQTTFGSQYTRRSEQIMNDVKASKKQTADFLSKIKPQKIEFQVTTISLNSWSLQRNVFNIKMDPFENFQKMFEEFYVAQTPQTKLEWQFDCSTCLLEGTFNKQKVYQKKNMNKYKVQVSLMQSLILLLFNENTEYTLALINSQLKFRIKTSDQEKTSDFLQEEIVKSLIALSNMKEDSNFLFKSGDQKSLSQNDVFTLNSGFSSKKKLIRVNQLQKKESKKEIEETTSNVLHERTFMIDAALVKLMKNLKSAELNVIVSKVQEILKIPLKIQDIKLQIQQLIKRDYLVRDEDQMNLFHYQA